MNQLRELTERWGKLPTQQRAAIGVVMPLILFAAFYFGLLSGLESKIEETQGAIRAQQSTQGDLELEIRNRRVLEQEFKFKQARVKEIEQKIPKTADPGGLLDRVYEVAAAARLDLRVFKPESELQIKEMALIVNKGEFGGRYHAVGEFLDRLTHLERLMKVLAIEFEVDPAAAKQKDSPLAHQLAGAATIVAFRLLRDDEIAASAPKKKKKRGRSR